MSDATGTRAAQSIGEDQNRTGGDGTERLATSGAAFSFATSEQHKSGDGTAPAPIEQALSGGAAGDKAPAGYSGHKDGSVVEMQASVAANDGNADVPAPEPEEIVESKASSEGTDAGALVAGPAVAPAQDEQTASSAQMVPAISDAGTSAVQPGVVPQAFAAASVALDYSPTESGTLMALVDVPVGAEELASLLSPTAPPAQSSSNVLDSFTVNVGTGLTFTLNDTGGAGAGTQALAGFQAAAALWAGVLSDHVNIVLDIGFSALDPGVLAQAGSTKQAVNYNATTAALAADATSADDTAAVANLQGGTSFNFASQNSSGTFVLDNNGTANNAVLNVNTANAKALGIATTATTDAAITFSNLFNWDFDQSDGVGAGLQDFVGVAFHEIGHALGFVSGVDVVDFNPTLNLDPFRVHSVLDLFRYSANTVNNFGGVQDLGYGTTSFFSVDGGTTNIGLFSTGVNNGDGQQASHWKDNLGIGIMDPTANPAGQINTVSATDLRAFDAIGWNLTSTAPQPVELFNAGAVSQGTFATIQTAENSAGAGFRIVVNGATYTGNPENVTIDQNNMFFDLPTGVTPTLNLSGVAANLTLQGAGNATVNGTGSANILTGNAGNNTLNGGGGADQLIGLGGNDSYVVDNVGDVITEQAGGGDDTVFTSIDYTVGANVEVINITNAAGAHVFGNASDNFMFGGAGNDILDGVGGTDLMQGGAGNDVYAVDNSSDSVIEAIGGGFDNVFTTVDYIIDAAQEVESVILRGTAVQAFGDNSDNQLIGNDVGNVLLGNGGTDYMVGNGGDDIFVITPETGAVDVVADFVNGVPGVGDRMSIFGFGPGATVTQVSQESFLVSNAAGTITQQFILQGYNAAVDGPLTLGDDYYFDG